MNEPASILEFPDGIPGFPSSRRFVLSDLTEDAEGPFQVLQSLDDPTLSMVVSVPWPFFPDYSPRLDETDRAVLELDDPEDAVVFCGVTADPDNGTVFLNLLGPFVVNARTLRGRQVVLTDPQQPARAPVLLRG
ncbi:MAG TPA: flagellar assembly protein FliW [Egibacteraceae bacterium]|jgi:flagellar assembly factor FliW|nr:flagellar assembly protein FliW [Egibacteraceae bacterium]